jgi:hypothetical protein
VVSNSCEDFALAIRRVADLAIAANLRFGSGNVGYSVDVLGYKMGVGEWKPLEKALETIAAFLTPRTKKQVRSFLGKTGYHRSLVPEFAVLAGPLEELTGNKESQWGPNKQKSFEGLQRALVKDAVVASYSASKAAEIFTDASKDRMGACLVQKGKVVDWFSRRLKGPQLKWSVTLKEARELIEAVRNWRHVLVQPTTVWTDHQALEGWARGGGEQDDPCLVRWGLWLQGQPLTVRWRPGADNGVADHESRVAAQESGERPLIWTETCPRAGGSTEEGMADQGSNGAWPCYEDGLSGHASPGEYRLGGYGG